MTMNEYVRDLLERDQGGQRLGIEVTEAADGYAVARLSVVADMTNGLGIAQGGFLFALADQAFACAANSVAEATATVDASISYVSPAAVGDELVAEARVVFRDQRRVVIDVTVRAGERVVALFRATGRTMRPATP